MISRQPLITDGMPCPCDKRERMWIRLDGWMVEWLALIGVLACGPVWDPDAQNIHHSLDLLPSLVLTHIFPGQMCKVHVELILLWSFGPAMSQNVWHTSQLKHPTTELSHVSILASFRERICAFMVLHQPLIWSQPTTASPACPNLMIITTPHASFLSTKVWHWYLTIRLHLIFFVPKTSVLFERQLFYCIQMLRANEYNLHIKQMHVYQEKWRNTKGGKFSKQFIPFRSSCSNWGSSAWISPEGCQQAQVSLGTQEMEPTCNLHIWDSLTNKAFLMHLPVKTQ